VNDVLKRSVGSRLSIAAACAAMLALVASSVIARTAQADTPYPSVPAAAVGTDGGNPTRCARDAQIVQSIPIRSRVTGSSNIHTTATLQLRWSPSCQGNWARLVANRIRVRGGVAGYYGRIWVTGGMFGHSYSYGVRDPNTSSQAFYTSMVWAPSPSCASAHAALYNTMNNVVIGFADTGCF
jgi:hypothetical protein